MSTTARFACQTLLLSLCLGLSIVDIKSASAQDNSWTSTALSAEISAGRNIYAGARGGAVSELQSGLKRLGYQVSVDGVFGPQTLTFVRDFQRAQGLTADGIVGRGTFAALERANQSSSTGWQPATPAPTPPGSSTDSPPSSTGAAGVISEGVNGQRYLGGRDGLILQGAVRDGGLRRGSKGAAVEALQRRLNELGYPASVDGDFGPQTEAALKRFQADHGRPASGEMTAADLTALADATPRPAPAPTPSAPTAGRVQRNLSTGTLVIPGSYRPTGSEITLLVHFHGDRATVERELAASGFNAALVVVNYNGFASAYTGPFGDPSRFERILSEALREIGSARGITSPRLSHLTLSSFSAGYGAIRQILSHGRQLGALRGVVLSDSLHASYEGGRPAASQMAPFVAFARRAAADNDLHMVISHSSIVPGSYASTTDTADAILASIGATRHAVSETGARGMHKTSETRVGGVVVFGYAGRVASDHIDQLQTIGQLFAELR